MSLDPSVIVASLALVVAGGTYLRGGTKDTAANASKVEAIAGRVSDLERRANEMNASLQAVQRDVAILPAMKATMDGLDRLVTYRLDQVADQLRAMAERMDAPVTLPPAGTKGGSARQHPPIQR